MWITLVKKGQKGQLLAKTTRQARLAECGKVNAKKYFERTPVGYL
jgi:hypothetical protein